MKKCAKCKQTLELTDFTVDSRTTTGRASWCRTCMNTQRRAKLAAINSGEIQVRVCLVEGCGKPAGVSGGGFGYCQMHYIRWKKYGDLGPSHRLTRKDGEGHLSKDGYIIKSYGDRRCFEHRRVMESILRRPLLDVEEVHHRNGIRSDNRPANLELWSRSHPSGTRVRDLLEWASFILDQYSDLVDTESIAIQV